MDQFLIEIKKLFPNPLAVKTSNPVAVKDLFFCDFLLSLKNERLGNNGDIFLHLR